MSRGGADARNPFGLAYADAGRSWTTALCEADSDGDGQTNGFELGDPDCVWTTGATPSRTTAISHPGFADTYVDLTTNTSVITETTTTTTTTTTTASSVPGETTSTTTPLYRTGTEAYECVSQIGGGIELHSTITGDTTVDIAIRRFTSGGYGAIGFSAGPMVGPCLAVTTANGVERYTLAGPGSATPSSDTSVPFTWTSSDSTAENGQLIGRVFGADMSSQGVTAGFSETVSLIWAIGDSSTVAFHSSRGTATVNFGSCVSTSAAGESIEDDVKLHGLLQITAWCFLAPFAVFMKRLGVRTPALQKILVPGVKLPLPYVMHVLIMLTAIALSLSAVGIAKDKFSSEVDYGHDVTALIVVVCMVIQPFPAIAWQLCKPAPTSENFHKAHTMFGLFHRGLGIIILIVATVTCFTGISNYKEIYGDDDQAGTFRIVAILGVAIINLLPVLVEAKACITGENKASGNKDAGGATTVGKSSE